MADALKWEIRRRDPWAPAPESRHFDSGAFSVVGPANDPDQSRTGQDGPNAAVFVVPGHPVPKGRPRFGRGRVFTPAKTVAFEKLVADCAEAAGIRVPLVGRLALRLRFHVSDRRADVDNLVKAVSDALNKLAWNDDRQIDVIDATRVLDKANPRTEVRIEVLSAA